MSGKSKKDYLKRKKAQRKERQQQDWEDEERPKQQQQGGGGRAPPTTTARIGSRAGRARANSGGGGGGLIPPTSTPLQYVPLVELPGGARMPELDLAEVGWADAAGAAPATTPQPPDPLPMPLRPDWRAAGVATAEALHALEEREFERWAARLRDLAVAADRRAGKLPPAAGAEEEEAPPPLTGVGTPRAGGPGWGAPSLSFFEGRLDFWRQLWRTLEMSDALLVLADCRNPLLHWPAALHAEACRRGLPVVLVLSKADLVPAAAVEAWRAFFARAYPGLTVVAVSAGGGAARQEGGGGEDGGAAAAAAAAAARHRRAAHELVSAVLALEVARDDGSGRFKVGEYVGMGADEVLDHSARRNQHARREVASRVGVAASVKGDEEDDSDDDDDEWTVRGTKARKALAKKQQRQHRMAVGKGGGGGGAKKQQQKPPPRGKKEQSSSGSSEDEDSGSSSESGSGSERSWSEDNDDENDDEPEHVPDHDPDLARRLNSLTLEGQLRGGGGEQQQQAQQHAAAAPRSQQPRPVVVGLVGEPNVGKSSALNALLGAHRVAVSAHPGRTRTYQTHWMAPRLVLCDCPGLVFPRRGVALEQQVLFGSFPIAQCRDPYGVVRYLAERLWPRAHAALRLQPLREEDDDEAAVLGGGGGGGGGGASGATAAGAASSSSSSPPYAWTPLRLCNALAAQRRWRGRRGGRLDTYRAANTILRAALAGRMGMALAFWPPSAAPREGEEGGGGGAQ
jgi:ribosome biogenesis GTPase A